jgi:hypothetical protein
MVTNKAANWNSGKSGETRFDWFASELYCARKEKQ